jgi:hypothetical protein
VARVYHPYHISRCALTFDSIWLYTAYRAQLFASCSPGPLCLLGQLVADTTLIPFYFLLPWMAGSKDPSSGVKLHIRCPRIFR